MRGGTADNTVFYARIMNTGPMMGVQIPIVSALLCATPDFLLVDHDPTSRVALCQWPGFQMYHHGSLLFRHWRTLGHLLW